MKLKRSLLKRILLIVTLGGVAFSIALSLLFSLEEPIQSNSAPLSLNTTTAYKPEVEPEKVVPGLPVRLKIPKINVDAGLEHVGITAQGEMAVPKGPTNAAWFNLGPRPGEMGSAVIDGHYGWENGIPAAFDNLDKLQKGDAIYVEDEKGATTIFLVNESRSYNPNVDATGVFSSNDGKAHLNLITCQGVWNAAQKSYSSRLVVFADKALE